MDIKNGILTTEFWLAGLSAIFVALFGVLMIYGIVNQEQATAWMGLAFTVIAVAVPVAVALISKSYTASRTAVKTNAPEA